MAPLSSKPNSPPQNPERKGRLSDVFHTFSWDGQVEMGGSYIQKPKKMLTGVELRACEMDLRWMRLKEWARMGSPCWVRWLVDGWGFAGFGFVRPFFPWGESIFRCLLKTKLSRWPQIPFPGAERGVWEHVEGRDIPLPKYPALFQGIMSTLYEERFGIYHGKPIGFPKKTLKEAGFRGMF